MVTESDTRVIDPEFAVYGPIGFDLGAFLANLVMSYYSQPGHATAEDDRSSLQDWLLEQIPIFWQSFAERFRQLWRDNAGGDAYPKDLFTAASDQAAFAVEQDRFLDELFADMVGFAGAKIIRRIFGFAHNADFEQIADRDVRAKTELEAVRLARLFLLEPQRFRTPADIVVEAKGDGSSRPFSGVPLAPPW
jgi:5-methylthioribose kinase